MGYSQTIVSNEDIVVDSAGYRSHECFVVVECIGDYVCIR